MMSTMNREGTSAAATQSLENRPLMKGLAQDATSGRSQKK